MDNKVYGRPQSPYKVKTNLQNGVATNVGDLLMYGDGGIVALEVLLDQNAGSMSDFVIQAQFSPNGEWHDYIGGSDFDSSSEYAMIKSSDIGPHEVGAGGKSYSIFRVDGIYRLRCMATNSTGGDVTIIWSKRKVF